MKNSSSGISLGLWSVGGIAGLYLIGAVAIYVDEVILKTTWLSQNVPPPFGAALEFLYAPLGELLKWLRVIPA